MWQAKNKGQDPRQGDWAMKRLAEKIAVLGTENSKGQFVKIKINVQTQRAKQSQKSRDNAKGEQMELNMSRVQLTTIL